VQRFIADDLIIQAIPLFSASGMNIRNFWDGAKTSSMGTIRLAAKVTGLTFFYQIDRNGSTHHTTKA
jgi:hypothetical protein